MVGGAGTAYALTRHRTDNSNVATPAPSSTADARATSPGADDRLAASAKSSSTAKASPSSTGIPADAAKCAYTPTSDGSTGRSIQTPGAHPKKVRSHVTLATNYGVIEADLTGDVAPCTVNSFLTLARKGYFTGTQCHRLTTDGLYVLQCGDPSGTGQGGPGYQFDDENLPTKSRPAYPRGTLAMANAGPGTNGSQFFLVYKDSQIDPNYSVFGKITKGLDVLDKIAAAGSDESNGPGDGRPKQEVTITRAG
ncbi:peptidylprolyl isomerase [Planosporangium flavigriseum]|nr:peptidylprolyl isomerase [Planosporangium flavigriseum]